MKFDWSKITGVSVEEKVIWLRAWEAQLHAHIARQRKNLDTDPSLSRELLLHQRERLLREIQAVAAAAEAGAVDLELQLSSLHIAVGCQQLLETNQDCSRSLPSMAQSVS